jgi:prevent-host-death family protein
MERELTVTEAARTFADVVARAYYRGESARLIKNGRAMARIVPVEEPDRPKTGAELVALWSDPARPRLTAAEARALEADLKTARENLPPLPEGSAWE